MNTEEKLTKFISEETFIKQLRTLLLQNLKEHGWKDGELENAVNLIISKFKIATMVKSGVNNTKV